MMGDILRAIATAESSVDLAGNNELSSSVMTSCFMRICACRDGSTKSRAAVQRWLSRRKERRCSALDVDVEISVSRLFGRNSILVCNVAISP